MATITRIGSGIYVARTTCITRVRVLDRVGRVLYVAPKVWRAWIYSRDLQSTWSFTRLYWRLACKGL